MRRLCVYILATLGATMVFSVVAHGQVKCVTSAPDGYRGTDGCKVTIDRNNPASPANIVVHGNTPVTIELRNARPNESVTFTPVLPRPHQWM